MRNAFRLIFSSSDLRALVVIVAVMAAAIAAAEGVLVLYSASDLHLSQALYPTLLASYSVGLLVSTGAVGRWGSRTQQGPTMLAALATIGCTLLLLGVFPVAPVAWCLFFLMGAAGGLWNVLSATRRQRRTPPTMVARVASTFRAISWGALPVGTALGGLIGQRWGVPAVFVVAGSTVLLLGGVMGALLVRPPEQRGQPIDGQPAGVGPESVG